MLAKLSISKKLWLLTTSIIVVFVISFYIYFNNTVENQFKDGFLKKGLDLVQSAAFNLGSGLYSGDAKDMQNILKGLENDPDLIFISIISDNGEEEYSYKTDQYLPVIQQFLRQENIYSFFENYLIIKHRIFFQDQYQGVIVAGFSLRWVQENIRVQKSKILIIGILLAIALLIFATFFARAISRPLKKAASTIKDYSDKSGALSFRLPVKGTDEIAQLAKALNNLADNLDSNILELNQSKRYLETMFQLSPISIIIADTVGQIEKVNHSACQFFGIEYDELVKMNLDKIIQPGDLDNILNKIIQDREKIRGYLCTLIMPNKSKKVVELNISTHQDENDYIKNVIIAIIDITEKIQIQREILHNQSKLQGINIELTKKTKELQKYSNLNKKNATSLEQLIGISQKIMRLVSADDILQTILESSGNLLEAEESIIFLWDNRSEKLTPFITKPKSILDRLVPEIPSGKNFIWKTFKNNESFVLESKKLNVSELRILGLDARNPFSLISVPISEKDYHLGVIVVLKKKLPAIRLEELHLINTLANQTAILLDNRHLVKALEDKAQSLENAYSELQRSQQQVIQLQKMESIGTLVGGIAHDFNNILGIILPNTDLIKSELGGKSKLQRRVNIIADAAQRAADLTKQLLMFSRHQDINVKILSPNHLVSQLSVMFERTLGKEYDILIDLDPKVEDIEGDENRLTQVLINLALNARDAMPNGGKIALRTRMCKYTPNTDKDSVERGYVCISMTDSGCGINEENFDKIFDPFFTTKSIGKGTGLGLSVVYGIMQSHRGYVDVESEVGVGTTFYLYFPPVRKSQVDAIPAIETERAYAGEKILIVDDEKMIRESTREILKSLGYTVAEASSGSEAIDIVRRNKSSFHLAIVDLSMPKMNGIETIRRLKEMDDKIRMVISTGHLEKEKFIPDNLKVDGILTKPYRMRDLAFKVRQILGSAGSSQ